MNIDEVTELSDKFIEVQAKRLAKEAEAKKLKAQENALFDKLVKIALDEKVASLPATAPRGLNFHEKMKPRINSEDPNSWQKLYSYITRYDAFDLLHKRLGEEAAETRIEDGIDIPGVILFPVYKLTIIGKK